MISCSTAASMTERSLGEGLSFSEKLKWRYHVKVCEICQRYKNQQYLIDDALKHRKNVAVSKDKSERLQHDIEQKVKDMSGQ
mgnify:CR=1 FL=1